MTGITIEDSSTEGEQLKILEEDFDRDQIKVVPTAIGLLEGAAQKLYQKVTFEALIISNPPHQFLM